MFQRNKHTTPADAVAQVQTDLASQRERLAAAERLADELERQWAAACLAHDVDGAPNDGEIATIESDQAACDREIARAANAVDELEIRLAAAKAAAAHEVYLQDFARLSKLEAAAPDLIAAYKAAAIAHVDAQHAIHDHNAALAALMSSCDAYAQAHGEERPTATALATPRWFDLWLTDPVGPEEIRRRYA
jgi:hypothetical protein